MCNPVFQVLGVALISGSGLLLLIWLVSFCSNPFIREKELYKAKNDAVSTANQYTMTSSRVLWEAHKQLEDRLEKLEAKINNKKGDKK